MSWHCQLVVAGARRTPDERRRRNLMGWSYGIAYDGREIGYGVEAICDQPGCDAKIDRGIGYLCGDHAGLAVVLDGADGPGCGRYYCGQHNYFLSEDGSCDHAAVPAAGDGGGGRPEDTT